MCGYYAPYRATCSIRSRMSTRYSSGSPARGRRRHRSCARSCRPGSPTGARRSLARSPWRRAPAASGATRSGRRWRRWASRPTPGPRRWRRRNGASCTRGSRDGPARAGAGQGQPVAVRRRAAPGRLAPAGVGRAAAVAGRRADAAAGRRRHERRRRDLPGGRRPEPGRRRAGGVPRRDGLGRPAADARDPQACACRRRHGRRLRRRRGGAAAGGCRGRRGRRRAAPRAGGRARRRRAGSAAARPDHDAGSRRAGGPSRRAGALRHRDRPAPARALDARRLPRVRRPLAPPRGRGARAAGRADARRLAARRARRQRPPGRGARALPCDRSGAGCRARDRRAARPRLGLRSDGLRAVRRRRRCRRRGGRATRALSADRGGGARPSRVRGGRAMKWSWLLGAVALAGYLLARRRVLRRWTQVAGWIVVAAAAAVGVGVVHLPKLEKLILDVGEALGSWTYLLVGILAFLETGAFIGLVAPGETAVIVGGLVAGQHQISLPVLIAIVWACAVAGDLTSYTIGRRLGREFLLRHGERLKITEERLGTVEDFFARRGGATILIGRFIGFVRALAPFVAGASRMP